MIRDRKYDALWLVFDCFWSDRVEVCDLYVVAGGERVYLVDFRGTLLENRYFIGRFRGGSGGPVLAGLIIEG